MKSVYDFIKIADYISVDYYKKHTPNMIPQIVRDVAAGLKGEGYTLQDFTEWNERKGLEGPEGAALIWEEVFPEPACAMLSWAESNSFGMSDSNLLQCCLYKVDILLRQIYQGASVSRQELKDAFPRKVFSADEVTYSDAIDWLMDAAETARKNGTDFYAAMYSELLAFMLHTASGRGSDRTFLFFLDPYASDSGTSVFDQAMMAPPREKTNGNEESD